MVLYSADISNLAKPVKSVKNTKEPSEKKRVRKRKEPLKPVKAEEKAEEKVEEKVEEIEEPKLTVPKKKYVAKKPKAPVPDVAPEPVPVETPVAVEEPQEPQEPKKRKRAKKEVVQLTPPPSPKKKKVFRDPTVPPLWFKKYMEGVSKEKAALKEEKVPAKTVKKEAEEAAQKSWDDGLTRDRVTNEVDNHMNRMYSMIFSRR